MITASKKFRNLEISEQSLVEMPFGMFGFEEMKEFVLLEKSKESPFKLLQATADPNVAFLLIDPLEFFPDYEIDIPSSDAEQLKLDDALEARVLATVTIDKNHGWFTANLVGPIVINSRTLEAKQIVLDNERYGTKHLFKNESLQGLSLELKQAI